MVDDVVLTLEPQMVRLEDRTPGLAATRRRALAAFSQVPHGVLPAVEPTRPRGRRGVATGPARRRPQRAAAAPSQSLVNRRRPVLSVMVVASRPFDMVPDGLRAQSGQLFGGRGLLYGGRGARCAAEAGVEH